MGTPLKQKLERAFYETKPFLFIGLGAIILVGTSWGIPTLLLSLAALAYAGMLLFWRMEFRGSLKKIWFGKKDPQPKDDPPKAD